MKASAQQGKRITFLVPPAADRKRVPERVFGCSYTLYPIPNIPVLTLVSVMEAQGWQVSYEDFPMERRGTRAFRKFLNQDPSDVYCLYTVNLSADADRETLAQIRQARGAVPVCFMGPAPTHKPETFLSDTSTFVIRGEMDATLPELAEALVQDRPQLDQVEGVSCLSGGSVRHNAPRALMDDLDALPFPQRRLIRHHDYFNPKLSVRPVTAMLTSRGCAYECIYCVPNSVSFARELEHKAWHSRKPPVRKRSAQNVIEEFREIRDQGYRGVKILDDQFVVSESRTVEICEGIRELGIKWSCLARADHLNERIVKAMAEAHCEYIDIGIESFEPEILKYIKKNLDVDTAIRAIKLVQRHGIRVKINLMLGSSPLDTRESLRAMMRKVRKIAPHGVTYAICNPFPGTEFHRMARENGWTLHDCYQPVDVRHTAVISYPNLSARDLERLVRRADFDFFLRPRFVLQNLYRFLRPGEIRRAAPVLAKRLLMK